ncbi:hypothetical protein AMJ57_02445, partial [Parcubacteria bacterium SG8_24]
MYRIIYAFGGAAVVVVLAAGIVYLSLIQEGEEIHLADISLSTVPQFEQLGDQAFGSLLAEATSDQALSAPEGVSVAVAPS